ncbi:unnamed protein product, partial [Rotaria sordida]
MKTHLKSCSKPNETSICDQKSVKEFYSSTKTYQVPQRIKSAILRSCAEFAAIDNRAFETMAGDGFKSRLQQVFDAGRVLNTSSLDVEALIPHPTTISRDISRIYDIVKRQLIELCEKMDSFCIIVDRWTEHYT